MIEETQTKTQAVSKQQVWDSWLRIKRGGKGLGVDGVSMEMIEKNPRKYLYPLWNRLASGSYYPPPVKEVPIPKGNGKERMLGIPTILDRVAQGVIHGELEQIVEPLFHPSSFGYRRGKSAHQALDQCAEHSWNRYYVIDLDIKGFFDNINHERMMERLRKYTAESHILLYCERWLKARVQKGSGELQERDKGTPQGGVISPLLANLYLHEVFDQWLAYTQPHVVFERYADDIVIHTRSREQSGYLMDKLTARFARYSLEMHPEKTKIVYCWRHGRPYKETEEIPASFDFLGYTFRPRLSESRSGELFWGFRPAISKKSEKRITGELRKLRIHRWTHYTIRELSKELAPKIRGWLHYYGRFRQSELSRIFWNLNVRLVKWAKRKYKLLTYSKAYGWLKRVMRAEPNLFIHWQHGFSFAD